MSEARNPGNQSLGPSKYIEVKRETFGAMLEALKAARPVIGASAFNLSASPSKNSRRSARDYGAIERQILDAIAKAEGRS